MKNKVVLLLCSVAVAATLMVGCGSKDDANTNTDAVVTEEVTEAPAEEDEAEVTEAPAEDAEATEVPAEDAEATDDAAAEDAEATDDAAAEDAEATDDAADDAAADDTTIDAE